MNSSLNKISKNKYDLSVQLNSNDLKGYIRRVEDTLISNVQVDGFRKGKVPQDIAKEKIDKDTILQTAMNAALKESFSRAIKENDLDIIKTSSLKIKENSSEALNYNIVVNIFPEVVLGDLSGIRIKKRNVSVSKDEVEQTINTILSSRADLSDKDTPIENGDKVEIDFEVKSEGRTIDGGISKDHPLIVGNKGFIPGFEDNLIGMKKGQEKNFSLIAPKDYYQKDIAGKKLDFKIKVNTVQKVKKPYMDDDFVKTLGDFKSVDDFKSRIKNNISDDKIFKETQRVRLEILDNIASRSKIDLDDEIVDERIDNMVNDFDNDLHQKGMELSLYLARLNKSQDSLRDDWKSEAEKQVKLSLVLRKLARDNNISASPEEVDSLASKKMEVMMFQNQAGDKNINPDLIREETAREIINEKTLAYIESKYLI